MRIGRTFLIGAAIASLTGVVVAQRQADPVTVPAWLEAKLPTLTAQQRAYLVSKKGPLADRPDLLKKRLDTKTPEEALAYIDGMMAVEEASKFHARTDMASIPLNTDSPEFNAWKVKRPPGMDPARKPGPFSLSRYASDWGSGIATFAGAPVAITPADLRAGKVDVAIVGVPLDMGSGYRGAKGGPQALRALYGAGGIDMTTLVDPSVELSIVDYGDIAVDNMSTELTMHHVRQEVAEIARTGALPFIVGGDHSLEYSDVAGLADVHGKENIGVVHFDSHYDAGNYGAHKISHGQPIYRLIKEGHVLGRNYIQVGLRGPWPEKAGFEWMREQGMRYHPMAEVEKNGWEATMERALKEAREGGKKLYISFDVDVLDPAFVVGTGTPVPGGLTMREAVPIVRRLCAENDVVGFEIVEVAPQLDVSYKTALNANFIMHACLTGVAMRRKGITQPGYLSELTTDHAADKRPRRPTRQKPTPPKPEPGSI